MGVVLEIKSGPMAGKTISLATGQSVTIGRSATRAEFALTHDTFMSGLHFAIECGSQGCRILDRKSSNGTFLNGARIQDAMLANGDEIKGGQTIFTVRIIADAKLPTPELPPTAPSPREVAPPAPPRPDSYRDPEPVAPPRPPSGRLAPAEPVAPPPAMRTAEPSREVLDSALSPAAGSELESDFAPPRPEPVEPPARRSAPPPAPPVRGEPVRSAQSGDSAPQWEEPPRVRSIPTPPVTPARPVEVLKRTADRPVDRAADRVAPRGPSGSREAAFTVMGWSFPAAPPEWQVQEGFGLKRGGGEDFPSSVAASEESLGGITLQQFVESQISTLRGYLRGARIEPTMPPRVSGADESMAVDVRHSTKDGRELVYRRIYARSGSSVGVLTVTTLSSDFEQVLGSLQPLLEGAAFRSSVSSVAN